VKFFLKKIKAEHKIKKTNNSKYSWRHGVIKMFKHCLWEYKMI
jgi:hypothetical protein